MKWLLFASLLAAANLAQADENVRGHYRKDGKYVQPHKRSNSDDQRYNNYNSEGGTNPYTGEKGTRRNEMSRKPARNKKRH